jgi:hypothetical protein
MNERAYEAPSIVEIGTLQELTLQNKDTTGLDGISLIIPGNPPVPLGPVS